MLRGGHSTRTAARHFGYAQSTIVKWWKRKDEAWHRKELPARSSRPHTSPRRTPREMGAMIIGVRQGYASWSKRSNTYATIPFLKKVREYFPFQIRCIQTDKGSGFGKFSTDAVARAGMTHRHIHPRSPNENGHLERFNRTLQEELPKQG